METLSGLSKDSPEISVEGPFLLWVPAALPLHCTISSPSALKILLLPKEVCFIKEKKKIITTVWKHKALFLNCLMARCVFFFCLFPLAEETSKYLESEADCVGGYSTSTAMGRSNLIPCSKWGGEQTWALCLWPSLAPSSSRANRNGILPYKFLALHTKDLTYDVALSSSSLADPTSTARCYWAKYRRKCFQQLLFIHVQNKKAAKLDFFHICAEEQITCWVFSHICAYSFMPHKKKGFFPITPICVNTDVLLSMIQSVTRLHFLIITVLQFSLSTRVICHCPYPINHNSLHN